MEQVTEFVGILQEEDNFPAQYFFDVRPSLKRIRVEGMYLDEQELFDLRRSLETIRDIVRFLQKSDDDEEEGASPYPCLKRLAGDITVFPQLIAKINCILSPYGKIKDNASTELARIRRELASTMGSISRSLNSILRNAQSEGVVDKDVTPTMRDGRLVIPVAPALKRKIRGIVHDESASGKTVFIEPAEVVEANNRIRELEGDERREIIRILTDFSNQLRPSISDVLLSYEFLAEIDFIRAKALFAEQISGLKPALENKQLLDWTMAVHPLLQLSLAKHGKKVVPLDIELNEKQRILIISGPNAGGKSVCLKTVGLLQYMLQSGLLIPMHERSHAGIFSSIFIDIGDEQSIEDDLSTYSSHLMNMKIMMKNCNEGSLILIDEFGGGTEPQIGGAIAEAVLKRFNQKGTFGVITTHYQNLKHFAEDHEGVVNGAMLYDRHLMQALFQLQIGNPGSSFAVEIARKIGLPEDVIADASDIVGSEYINADKYLQDIVRDKRYWEGKRQTIRQREKHMEDTIARYQAEMDELQKSRKEIIKQAKEEAQNQAAQITEAAHKEGFEAVFIGSGAGLPMFMGIPGENANGVFSANEYLTRNNLMKAFMNYDTPIHAGKKVVVVGGGSVGLDVIEYFAPRGAECTIIDMLPQIGMLADPITKCSMRETHDKYGVKEYVNTALQEVKENAFTVKLPDGTIQDLEFDYGFNCLGMRSNNPVLPEIQEAFADTHTYIYTIGDSVRARRIMEGTMEGRAILNVLESQGYLHLEPLE